MKTKKKNRFLTFCFSCMPGAGEMYMGFMKMGLSLMLLFFLTIAFSVWVQQGVIACLCIVVWFYSFFHANHLASLNDEEFAHVEDEYLLGLEALSGAKSLVEKCNKWIACGLIFIGASILWSTMGNFLRRILPEQYEFIWRFMYRIGSYLPSIVIGCGIIVLGVKMLSGKEMEIVSGVKPEENKITDDTKKEDEQEGK